MTKSKEQEDKENKDWDDYRSLVYEAWLKRQPKEIKDE